MVNDTQQVWFITGVSRGFGRELARTLLDQGQVVIGTTRDGQSDLPADGRLHILPLDVTDAAQVKETVAKAHALHGRLDVVVNNAGYGLLGAVEDADTTATRQMFEVNFFGALAVMQAALPLMRARRSGHIVNITSIAGLAPGVGSGLYAASKFALEGVSLSLAQEVAPLGIGITLVEPGAFRTDFLTDHSLRLTGAPIADYAATAGAAVARLQALNGRQPGDPVLAARAIVAAVRSPNPPLHLVLGTDAWNRVQARQEAFTANLADWRTVTLGTDFPA
ncbi:MULTISPECIES: oxidoreductase [Nitrospirillum]|uniref:NADP-dependent 3-hydroxy acid dehydrogenase YdfG n=1 Tax=Nitrospirillum amazonense TaxID=28077 RepID=A0A560FXF7_9PROT|nr:oxidoreductase [Nitrospirillum amazonense]MEC4590427.1 oxidoreductase [Nitrospirillum amazonense]TWB26282.1 NADP-dependent 3-hydroxy acid dehydrogenase YdfG [Nitrospirillum amazonense]